MTDADGEPTPEPGPDPDTEAPAGGRDGSARTAGDGAGADADGGDAGTADAETGGTDADPAPGTLRVALAQLNYRVGDLSGNVAAVEAAHERARESGADLLVCSEMALAGYPPGDLLTRESFVDRQLDCLDRVADLTADGPAIVLGYAARNPAPTGEALRNEAALCADGELRGRTPKRLLPTYDVFDEDRYFAAGDRPVTHRLDVGVGGDADDGADGRGADAGAREAAGGADATAGAGSGGGDGDHRTVTLGISVCEDAWSRPDVWDRPRYDADPVADLADAGADLLVNVSASPFHVEKSAFRRRLMRDHAADHGLPLVFVNQVGATDDLVFDGRSLAVDADGSLRAELPAFEAAVEVVDVPLPAGDAGADRPQSGDPAPPQSGDSPAAGSSSGGSVPVTGPPEGPGPATTPAHAAEARRAIELGIRDYVRKNGFSGVVVGLSGGIDSSVTAALAARALGPGNVRGVAMPTRYTGETSTEDARRVADRLGIEFDVVSIEELFSAATDALDPVFDGGAVGLAEENVQSRLRGLVLMALSNESGDLVLAPGNKSELAVGYCTLYGDMVGALAPIADCYKTLVYAVAEELNDRARGAGERPPIPERVIEKPPSAELRPSQTDTDDLPPYAALDGVLDAYVDRGRSAAEIRAAGADPAVVEAAISRLHRAEYKRYQAAPALQVTPKAFASGWRYPLAANYDALVPDGTGDDDATPEDADDDRRAGSAAEAGGGGGASPEDPAADAGPATPPAGSGPED